MIALIWAMDQNRLIGKQNSLPWHLKDDLVYFKKITENQTVLMGHLTYLSMKNYYQNKSFPFKKTYVANHENCNYCDAIQVNDLLSFLKTTTEDIYIIGGKSIYEATLPLANKLYITYVLDEYEGDVYFPVFDLSNFNLVSEKKKEKLLFRVYERKN